MPDDAATQMDAALAHLRVQLLYRWREFPQDDALNACLTESLQWAQTSAPELITVTSPVSRVTRLRLAPLCAAADLDSFYHGESAELSVSHDGRCYLVYRRNDGGDYAVQWSSATLLPESLMRTLPDVLALALLEGDGHDQGQI